MSSVSHQIIIIRELKHLYLITVINSRPNLIVMIMGKIKFYHINFFILFIVQINFFFNKLIIWKLGMSSK